MVRLHGIKVLRFTLLSLLVLILLPMTTGAQTGTSDVVSPAQDDYLTYMPFVFRYAPHPDLPAPDLVVDSVAVNTDSAIVVIKNRGDAPVSSDNPFWVDLYIDPERMPTGVNQVWDDLCDQGIVWGIPPEALPLDPGETITLVYCSDAPISGLPHYDEYTTFDIALAPGTPIAVQVDSASLDDVVNGGVKENHEVLGFAYNNIGFTLSLAGSGCRANLFTPSESDRQPLAPSDWLSSPSRTFK